MPLQYDEEIGELVNVCIDCGTGPVCIFNDRCTSCHDAAMLPPKLAEEPLDIDENVVISRGV